ncbi:hypothetical protein EDC04DRAFT_2683291 [Pisolithus marmoratus]|nr:hypothetical protein EDC04DRAFT_2683291 [Pisolithus marmoratus]
MYNTLRERENPKGGCFCLARELGLSNYVPLCYGCGFVLCNLNRYRTTHVHIVESRSSITLVERR